MDRYLFKNCVAVTLDERQPVVENAVLLVQGDRLESVCTWADLDKTLLEGVKQIDLDGKVVLPGLVDAHSHLFQTAGRGLGDGLSLLPWLEKFMLPLASSLDPVEAVDIVALAGLSALLQGSTTVVDNHYACTDLETMEALGQRLAEIGVRSVLARGIFGPMVEGGRRIGADMRLFHYHAKQELDLTEQAILLFKENPLVDVWPMPENIVYVDPDLIVGCAELARKHDVSWQAHCSESRYEVEIFESIHGCRPMVWAEQNRIVDDRMTLAHGIWFDDEEISVLGQGRATIIHNPVSNQYLASGVIKLRQLLEAGVNVSLGTDGVAVCGMSLFEAMKSALLLQRVSTLDAEVTTCELMLEMATVAGGRMIRKDAGRLKAGLVADFVAVDLGGLENQPINRVVTALVMSGQPRVTDVVVNGEMVVRNGVPTKVDAERITARGLEAVERVIARAGINQLRVDWFDRVSA